MASERKAAPDPARDEPATTARELPPVNADDKQVDPDLRPLPRARRFIPRWLRSLIWLESASRYDAFLSYSWKSDRDNAEAIQAVLHRFLRPWYRVRAKSIFRDLSSMPAGSNLMKELNARIDRSDHLIVLASPAAALSRGMELEAQHWFSEDRGGEIIIVVTDGEAADWETLRDKLLPPTLKEKCKEPVWCDVSRITGVAAPRLPGALLRSQLIEGLRQLFLRLYPESSWEQLRGEERWQRNKALGLMFGALVVTIGFCVGLWRLWDLAERRAAIEEGNAITVAARQSGDQAALLDKALEVYRRRKHEGRLPAEILRGLSLAVGAGRALTPQHVDHDAVTTASRPMARSPGSFVADAGYNRAIADPLAKRGLRLLAASAAGTLACVVDDRARELRIVDLASKSGESTLLEGGGNARAASFAVTGNRLVTIGGFDHHGADVVRVWNPQDGKVVFDSTDQADGWGRVQGATLSAAGEFLVVTPWGYNVLVRGLGPGAPPAVKRLDNNPDKISSAYMSPDGVHVVVDAGPGLNVFNALTEEKLARVSILGRAPFLEAFSRDGSCFLTTLDDRAQVWRFNGDLLATLVGRGAILSGVFERNERLVNLRRATGELERWVVARDAAVAVLPNVPAEVDRIRFEASGRDVVGAVTVGGSVSTPNWNRIGSVDGPTAPSADAGIPVEAPQPPAPPAATVGRVAERLAKGGEEIDHFVSSPDGKRIATATRLVAVERRATDGSHHDVGVRSDAPGVIARIWDAPSGDLLFELEGHVSQIVDLAFSPDGRRLAALAQDHSVRIFPASAEALEARAEALKLARAAREK
jgi:WD40 repeat protein